MVGGITRLEIFAGQSLKKKTEGKQSINIYAATRNSRPQGPIIYEVLVSRHRIIKHEIIVVERVLIPEAVCCWPDP